MKLWTKILPFVIVEWFAKKHLSRNSLGNKTVVSPYRGVWLEVAEGEK
jgi:hypothetical protein